MARKPQADEIQEQQGPQLAGDNIEYEIEGTTLTIRVDLTQDFGPSNSGKTHKVASTGWLTYLNIPVDGTVQRWTFNMALFRPANRNR